MSKPIYLIKSYIFSIVAIDSHGAQSPSLDYQIIQCDGCGVHGDCDFENPLCTENDQFHKALCVCHAGYSGSLINNLLFFFLNRGYNELCISIYDRKNAILIFKLQSK